MNFTDDLIKEFGSQVSLAEKLGIRRQNINAWIKRGYIPWAHRVAIERLTNGKFIADTINPNPSLAINKEIHES
jgi:DNA-binding transcriptional regulator YdaS (Cro superfamily)